MKKVGYTKRPQGRSSERHRPHHKQTNRDAGEGKIRGNPQQCVEKYLLLARDAASAGDPISAENYYQFADHYYRMAMANRASRMPPPVKREERKNDPSPSEGSPETPSPSSA